jgi:sporulation protein YlmC with PRC-barrel domain
MVFRLFSSSKSVAKKYRRYVGKPVVLNNGDSLGTVDSITLSKRDMRPIALIIRMRNGATRELDLGKVSARFEQDRVVVDAAPVEVEYNTIISTLRSEE